MRAIRRFIRRHFFKVAMRGEEGGGIYKAGDFWGRVEASVLVSSDEYIDYAIASLQYLIMMLEHRKGKAR